MNTIYYCKKMIALCFVACSAFLFCTAEDYSAQIAKTLPQIQTLTDDTFTANDQDITDPTLTFIPADDEGFYYTSRVDFADKAAPVLIWEGTTIQFTFTGTRLGLRFKDSTSTTSYYNVIIDGQIALLHMETGGEYDYFINKKLSEGIHTCVVFKRNEAGMKDTFTGIDIDAAGKLGPKPERAPVKIEFYGDSITAGVCDETSGPDSYDSDKMVTHNAYTAYPAIACRDLGAELSDLAVGGTGVSLSWNEFIMTRSWKNLYAYTASKKYDFSTGRTPDIVVINLGQNDVGLSTDKGKKFPSDFEEKYTAFLKEIRAQYPNAWIIVATGGMGAVKSSRDLVRQIANAVKAQNDTKIIKFEYRAFTYNHPRVDTHLLMAKQLENFIKTNVKIDGVEWK
jgi:lysophospholipase L1-like esterase